MGMDADLLAIGPVEVLKKWDALSYADNFYDDVPKGTIVIGTVSVCWTSDMSRRLATLCGVDPWDLGAHQINQPIPDVWDMWDELVGDESVQDTLKRIKGLLKDGAQLWYRPNG